MGTKESGAVLNGEATLQGSPSPFVKLTGSAFLNSTGGVVKEGDFSLPASALLTGFFPINSFRDVKAWFRGRSLEPLYFPGNNVNTWQDQSSNGLTLYSQGPNDPTFGLDEENRIPHLSFSYDQKSYMITNQSIDWSNGISIFIRFKTNTNDENLSRAGSLLSATKDGQKGSSLSNVPLNFRYVKEDDSNQFLFKTISERAITYWDCESKEKWTTFGVVLDGNWFSICNKSLSSEKDISWKSEGDSSLGIEDPFEAKLAIGFKKRDEGRLNADINEIALFDRGLSKSEAIQFTSFLNEVNTPVSTLAGEGSLTGNGEAIRGGSTEEFGVDSTATGTLSSSREYVEIDDISTIQHWDTALDEPFEDGKEIITWDGLSATGMETVATYNETDNKISDGFPSVDVNYPSREEQWFSSHPDYFSLEEHPFTLHLLGYVNDRSKFFTIKTATSELFSLELEENETDRTMDNLIVRTNTDFFESRSVTYDQIFESNSFFLLTVSVTASDITTYLHQDIGGNGYNPSVKTPSSLEVSQDDSTGTGDFLPNRDGFIQIDEGTFSEVVLYRGTDSFDRNFTWDWIYTHYRSE